MQCNGFSRRKGSKTFINGKMFVFYFSFCCLKCSYFLLSDIRNCLKSTSLLSALHAGQKLVDKKLRRNFSFNIQYQPFQIFTLGVINAHRVVGGLCQLVKYANVALCHCRSGKYCCAEILLAHNLRT